MRQWLSGIVWALVILPVAGVGCKMTPDEIERIQVENELLRKEIQVIRQNCEYYRRTLRLEVEESEPDTPDSDSRR